MKLSALIVVAGIFGATSAMATPYYVGENLSPRDNINLGFKDAITKKAGATRTSKGNVAAFELDGAYNVMPNLALGANLPFFMASKHAVSSAGSSRTSLGNLSINGTWSNVVSPSTQDWQWGYSLGMDIYMPTSRKAESAAVSGTQPTTEFFRYARKTTTASPKLGLFLDVDQVEFKGNIGYHYSYVAGSGINDRNRNNFTGQIAMSWTPYETLALNVEYNAIAFDARTTAGGKRYRHALTPSVTGEYQDWFGGVNVAVPLDSTTRDYAAVAFGLDVGYLF